MSSHKHDMKDADTIGESSVWSCGHSVTWVTTQSHPASGTRYQEAAIDGLTWARVVVNGREVVSPTADTDNAMAQYTGRYLRSIGE